MWNVPLPQGTQSQMDKENLFFIYMCVCIYMYAYVLIYAPYVYMYIHSVTRVCVICMYVILCAYAPIHSRTRSHREKCCHKG